MELLGRVARVASYFNPLDRSFDATTRFSKLSIQRKVAIVFATVLASLLTIGLASVACFRFCTIRLSERDKRVDTTAQHVLGGGSVPRPSSSSPSTPPPITLAPPPPPPPAPSQTGTLLPPSSAPAGLLAAITGGGIRLKRTETKEGKQSTALSQQGVALADIALGRGRLRKISGPANPDDQQPPPETGERSKIQFSLRPTRRSARPAASTATGPAEDSELARVFQAQKSRS